MVLYIWIGFYLLISLILPILGVGAYEILKLFEKAIIYKLYLVFLDDDDGLREYIKHKGVLLNVLQFFIF